MARVKRGNVARKRRKKVLKLAKGFRGSLSKLYRPAKQAVLHALTNAYRDRRRKKRDFRSLWIVRINAGLISHNMSYSNFMGQCKVKNIEVNRKMLAELAYSRPAVFDKIVELAKA
jgi:large subunit ribosomal protein L20